MNDFGKLLTAVITPFDSNGVLSTDTLWRLCKKLVHEKSEGLVLSGTTGESPNLTKEDRKIIYSTAKDSVGDKVSSRSVSTSPFGSSNFLCLSSKECKAKRTSGPAALSSERFTIAGPLRALVNSPSCHLLSYVIYIFSP